jgi:hypothetical protein
MKNKKINLKRIRIQELKAQSPWGWSPCVNTLKKKLSQTVNDGPAKEK